MAEAAPGARPQMAVVPGSTWWRDSHHPRATLAAITSTVKPTNNGQSCSTRCSICGCRLCAIRQPISPCATYKKFRGTRTVKSPSEVPIPAAMQANNKAAGICAASSRAYSAALRPASTAHCTAGARRGDGVAMYASALVGLIYVLGRAISALRSSTTFCALGRSPTSLR